ncbi:MAG TPA: hypothetical protein VK815_10625 [Candidatus Acidoferrales bacterium]|jgi:hypothetical protein|nr:hypothetical protein [Candidatus Acidoferrales bacterium]
MATGKISRLPREIREQVNERLDAGEPGNRLVDWLNGLPAVRALLAAEFGGAAINEQNLTNWKQGGFREWRMEREVAAWGRINAERWRSQSNVEGEETFNAEHSTLNVQGDEKVVEPQIHPIEGQPTVTVEQLVTVVAVRYLAVVREWQQSPVPAERRWRQMQVILQDVMKLRQGELQEKRLVLDGEKLQFAKERFEDQKQTDDRRAMIGFLVAARQWPEVQEALAGAFRLFRERKEATKQGDKTGLESIKVNQGKKKFKREEAQTKLEDCSPSPVSSPSAFAALRRDRPGRGDDLARFLVQERITTSTAMGEVQTDVNKTELGPIKVDQGEIFKNVEEQDEVKNRGWYPRPCRDGARRSELAGRRPALPVVGARMDQNLAKLKPIKVDQGEIFYPEREWTETNLRKNRTSHPYAMAPPEAQARLDSPLPMSFN